MKPIGGYFELELIKGENHYHDTPFAMKSGRAALQYILNIVKPDLVFIPYYTCDALLEPFKTANVSYQFYRINESLEPETEIELKNGEYFLYVNYLDLKRETVKKLSAKYKDKLIVDCTQAFFMKGNQVSWFFNSCRKFFGVPDGSYLYAPSGIEVPETGTKNESYVVDHLLKRFNGHPDEGYRFFLENEILAGVGIARMSKMSTYLLSNINYDEVIKKRLANYSYLHERFKDINLFRALVNNSTTDTAPMSYPLLLDRSINKEALFKNKIFIPSFWKDTIHRNSEGFGLEKKLTEYLLPLPVDHRYGTDDMEFMYRSLVGILNFDK